MSIDKINSALRQVLLITDKWNEGEIKSIEKAVVLSKLQSVYDEILFSDDEPLDDEASVDDAPMDVVDFTDDKYNALVESAIKSAMEHAEVTAEPEVEVEPEVEPEPEIAEEPVVEEPVVEEPVVEEPVVEPQPVVEPRPKTNKTLIQSLYGDDDTYSVVDERRQVEQMEQQAEAIDQEVKAVEQIIEKHETVAPKVTNGVLFDVAETAPQHSVIDSEPKQVLSDVYAMQEHNTVADTIGRNMNTTDLATKIATDNTLDLRQSIGINDKFLLIRDVFDNDGQTYERVMDELGQCEDLNDALLYIHENITANPNSDGMKFLVELLSRKLS